jgi:DNA-3-methyladenine glycosylase I
MVPAMTKLRCPWLNLNNPLYVKYHDEEWGRGIEDDQKLFELLCLEGAQAGLSWEIVLNKREKYRYLFFDFNIDTCARLHDKQLEEILKNPGIVRNRLKVFSVRANAQALLKLQDDFGSFYNFLECFRETCERRKRPRTLKDYRSSSPASDSLSQELKLRGFKFIGSTICYAFMQAVGLVDDHSQSCFLAH